MKTSMNLQVITPQVTTEITNFSEYCYIYVYIGILVINFLNLFNSLGYFTFGFLAHSLLYSNLPFGKF